MVGHPLGLCLVGITGNVLYFGAGLTVQTIQLLFLCALVPCIAIVFRRGMAREEGVRLLAVVAMFVLMLALPCPPISVGSNILYFAATTGITSITSTRHWPYASSPTLSLKTPSPLTF